MIFPELSNIHLIDNIRDKYDPLSRLVRPHITLVFPFKSDISCAALHSHVESVLSHFRPFALTLQDIIPVKSYGNYLYLRIVEGSDQVTSIHKMLYTGILEPHKPKWLSTSLYYPHMTVGKIEGEEQYKNAIQETQSFTMSFNSYIEKVSVEIIGEDQSSDIEFEISLPQPDLKS